MPHPLLPAESAQQTAGRLHIENHNISHVYLNVKTKVLSQHNHQLSKSCQNQNTIATRMCISHNKCATPPSISAESACLLHLSDSCTQIKVEPMSVIKIMSRTPPSVLGRLIRYLSLQRKPCACDK